MKALDLTKPVFYQSKARFNNNPFEVTVLSIKGTYAKVRTSGQKKETFNCKISSLYN